MNSDLLAASLQDLTDAPHWYVGFSGGADSTALLHALFSWRRAKPTLPPLTAIHVNHGLQVQSDAWQAHCQLQCDQWQVPLIARAAGLADGQAGEAEARTARYAIFRDILKAGEVLLLAHHMDDQVETFFLRLLRGAGPEGLSGIPGRRPLGDASLVRPLLTCSRAELEDYNRSNQLDCIQDLSNEDTAIDRNFLRLELLPRLAERWPGYQKTVTRAADLMATTTDLLRDSLGVPLTIRNGLDDPGLELAPLLEDGEQAATVRLRHWLQDIGLPAPDRAPLAEFLRQLESSAADASPMLQCSAYLLRRYRDAVYAVPVRSAPESGELRCGQTLEIPGVGALSLVADAASGWCLEPGQSLRIAWRRGGERLRLRGAKHSISLKQLLQERGVPPWWRDFVPLLYLEDELLAVGDIAVCESDSWRTSVPGSDQLWRFVWDRPAAVGCA